MKTKKSSASTYIDEPGPIDSVSVRPPELQLCRSESTREFGLYEVVAVYT